jgi:hypothetical protein
MMNSLEKKKTATAHNATAHKVTTTRGREKLGRRQPIGVRRASYSQKATHTAAWSTQKLLVGTPRIGLSNPFRDPYGDGLRSPPYEKLMH